MTYDHLTTGHKPHFMRENQALPAACSI